MNMRLAYVVLLLAVPLVLLAQEDFDPVRLDLGTGINYFYPHVERDGANLLCSWSSVSNVQVATHGARVAAQGQVVERINYQEVPLGTIYCPGNLTILHAMDGSDPYMVYHS